MKRRIGVFCESGHCRMPFRDVKRTLNLTTRYDDDHIYIIRDGVEMVFDRDEFPTPWECVRSMGLLSTEAFTEAVKRAMKRMNKN